MLDLDIQWFFDNIDYKLMLHEVKKHTENRWLLLYIERWLKAPAQLKDGTPDHDSFISGKRAALLVTCAGPNDGNCDAIQGIFAGFTDYLNLTRKDLTEVFL